MKAKTRPPTSSASASRCRRAGGISDQKKRRLSADALQRSAREDRGRGSAPRRVPTTSLSLNSKQPAMTKSVRRARLGGFQDNRAPNAH